MTAHFIAYYWPDETKRIYFKVEDVVFYVSWADSPETPRESPQPGKSNTD